MHSNYSEGIANQFIALSLEYGKNTEQIYSELSKWIKDNVGVYVKPTEINNLDSAKITCLVSTKLTQKVIL